jgi:hypothetical protein
LNSGNKTPGTDEDKLEEYLSAPTKFEVDGREVGKRKKNTLLSFGFTSSKKKRNIIVN